MSVKSVKSLFDTILWKNRSEDAALHFIIQLLIESQIDYNQLESFLRIRKSKLKVFWILCFDGGHFSTVQVF